jgi:hypothetical protein
VSKKKKQDALQKAQKYISGSKLTKSEVKTLEKKGFSSKQISSVASTMKVGSQAQSRLDNKHSPSSDGGGGGGGPKRVQTVGTNRNVRVDNQGRAIGNPMAGTPYGGGWVTGDSRLSLNKDQAKKVNKKLDKYGGSLVGGKGMAVSGYVTVTDPGRYNSLWNKGGGPSRIGGGKHQLAIYAPLAQGGGKTKDPKPPSNSGGGRSSQPSPGGSKKEDRQQQSAYQRAQDHISARTPKGRPPEMQIRPGTAVEDIADYTNRLGVFNANYSGWMQDRAEADRYQSGRLLEQFAMGLPKAPDVMSGQEMIRMANQMNNRIKVG